MSLKFDSAPPDALAVFCHSNTPRYLYRKLRQLTIVQQIARQATIDELIAFIKAASESRPDSLEKVVMVYVCLVAISLQSDFMGCQDLKDINCEHLDWFAIIRDLAASEFKPSVFMSTEMAPTADLRKWHVGNVTSNIHERQVAPEVMTESAYKFITPVTKLFVSEDLND